MCRFRTFFVPLILGVFLLTSCNNPKKPSERNFTQAINQFFDKNGDECIDVGLVLPTNLSISDANRSGGIGDELRALEQAGLVHSSDITAVVQDRYSFYRVDKPRPAKHYEISDLGKKYYNQARSSRVFSMLGGATTFCYAHKSVKSIVKWNEPVTLGGFSETAVTYTYVLNNVADWAKRPEIEVAFPNVKMSLARGDNNQQISLQLTNKGWEVPNQ